MTVIGDAFVRVRPDFDGFDKEAESGISRSLGNAGKIAAGALATAGAAAVGFGTVAVGAFASFESGMREVFTVIPGISESAMAEMSAQAKQFASDFKVLPEDVVPALYDAIGAGIPPDNVFAFLETSAKLAKGGATDLSTAVDGLSSIVNAYGQDALSVTSASDILFKTVALGKGTVDEVAKSIYNVTPIASALGVSFEDVGASLALLTAQGTPVNVATTQMRALLAELGKEGTKASDVFSEMAGQSFTEFIAGGGDLVGALTMMQDAAVANDQSLIDLFGSIEAGQAALGLMKGEGEAFTDFLGQMQNSAGATDAAFQTMNQGVASSLDQLKADFAVLKLDVGEALAPLATEIVSVLGEAMKEIGPVLGELADIIGPILGDVLGELTPIISTIGSALGPVFQTLGRVIQAIPWDSITIAIGFVMDAVAALLPPLEAALTPILQVIGQLLPPIASIFALIAQTIAAVLQPVIEAFSPLLTRLAEIIDGQLNLVLEAVAPLLEELAPLFGEVLATAVQELAPLVLQLVEAILPLLPPILELIEALLPVLLDLFAFLVPIITDVQGTMIRVVTMAITPLVGAIEDIIGWVTDVITAFGDWWASLEDFWLDVQGFVEDVLGAFEGLAEDVIGAVTGFVEEVAGIADGLWEAFKDVFNRIAGAWNNTVGSLSFTVPSWVPGIGGKGFSVPDIPTFATGAIVRGAQVAVVGDRPEGEAVLTRPQLAQLISWAGAQQGQGGGVHFHGPVTFGADQREAVSELDWWARYRMAGAA